MHRTWTLSVVTLASLGLLISVAALQGQDARTAEAKPAKLIVRLPANAKLVIDDTATKSTGSVRSFETPPLEVGKKYSYTLKATWMEQGKEVVRQKDVIVQGGRVADIDLRRADRKADESTNTKTKTPDDKTLDTKPKKPSDNGTDTKRGKPDDKKTDTKPGKPDDNKTDTSAAKKDDQPKKPSRKPDILFVPTAQGVVDRMLEIAKVVKDDVVYDLGCGDGRIVVTAAKKYGCKATGFDIDPERVADSLKNVKKNKVEDLVTIKEADVFDLDLSKANVVTLYLLPELNVKLMPQLAKMKKGSRIVSHDFDMEGAKPKKVEKIMAKDDDGNEREHLIYYWEVPWEKDGK
jgi:uncharacterized protein (TIGR03000 family)